jgi:hypothetical protein
MDGCILNAPEITLKMVNFTTMKTNKKRQDLVNQELANFFCVKG